MEFPREVFQKLKYYVYLYSDPSTGRVFYVGKGAGNRAFSHLDEESDSDKAEKIRQIRKSGKKAKLRLSKRRPSTFLEPRACAIWSGGMAPEPRGGFWPTRSCRGTPLNLR